MGAKQFIKRAITGALAKKEKVVVPALQGELLQGRCALVTGGTSGIGYSIAEAFLANGAQVCITGRNEERCRNATAKLAQSGHSGATWICLDSRDVEQFDSALAKAEDLLGAPLDLLVNNAGVMASGKLSVITPESWDAALDTNLKGSYFLSKAFALRLIEAQNASGGGTPSKPIGNILNVASSSSLRPAATPYTISKWGTRGITLGLAKTLIEYGIVVNAVAPGPTATPMLLAEDSSNIDNPTNPTGRYATPEEIANMAVILTSSLGNMIVGDVVYMTGGAGLITFEDVGYGV